MVPTDSLEVYIDLFTGQYAMCAKTKGIINPLINYLK
jgi:hypothetical protein